jgi:hypothetical protein
MNNVSLILFYYILVGGLFTVYFYLALKRYSQGVGITFFNLSIFYYFVFFYVPFFYVVTGYYLKSAEFSVDFYFMSLYYSIVLVVFGIFYNLLIKIKATAPLLNNNSGNEENISYYFIALLVLVKIGLAFVELTPLQWYIFHGDFQGAHIAQKMLHKGGGFSFLKEFYSIFGPVIALIFIFKAAREGRIFLKLLLLFLAMETAGWYFSKSGIAIVFLTYLLVTKNSQNVMLLVIAIPIIAYFSFAIRLNTFSDYKYIFDTLVSRSAYETGYSLIHYDLIKELSPPLLYLDRYYIGFNTLFGVEPLGNWSKEAYFIETGKYGATTSGYAPVNLYAFFGVVWYLVLLPILSFIAYIDIKFAKISQKSYFLFVCYVFISLGIINSLTVDITRVVDFRFIFNPNVILHILLIFFVYRLLVVRK